MKAKLSPSILRMALVAGLALCCLESRSQSIFDWEAWRSGRNIAGLGLSSSPRGDVTAKIAESSAELSGGCTWGGLKGGSEAQTLWSTAASAQTEVHWSDFLMTGDFSFSMESGRDMMGSMFTRPGYYPIDVLEFTPGQKTLQNYGIGGGLAWKNGSRFIPGGTFRFEGANYAKRKDIRHTTYRQEIEIVPSVVWDGPGFALGASLIMRKTSEFVQAEQVGTATADSYYAFLDKGMMYGSYQVWNGSGVHLDEAGLDRLPVKEFAAGLALQASVGDWLYADFEYRTRGGEIGEKGYSWFTFPGSRLKTSLSWTLHRSSGIHVLRAEYQWGHQELDETVLEKTSFGGVTTPTAYGSNRVYERRSMTVSPSYDFYGKSGLEIHSSLVIDRENQRSTLMYPFLDLDEGTVMELDVNGLVPVGDFEIEAGLLFGSKLGERSHIIDNDNIGLGVSSFPFRLQEWWDMEQQLADATHIGTRLGLRWNFSIAGRYDLFLAASWSLTHAFGITLLPGTNRQIAELKIGYDF